MMIETRNVTIANHVNTMIKTPRMINICPEIRNGMGIIIITFEVGFPIEQEETDQEVGT